MAKLDACYLRIFHPLVSKKDNDEDSNANIGWNRIGYTIKKEISGKVIDKERSLIRSTTRVWPQEIVIHRARAYMTIQS